MIVDASALLAVILSEPERDQMLDAMNEASDLSISVINFVEAGVKVDKDPSITRALKFDQLISELAIVIVPVTLEQGQLARDAHKKFGRGSGHPARLNLGDCFAYALATSRRQPLLFKGNDFAQTDIKAAL